jgi:DNA-binding IclR family transcriptional regulator
MKKYTGEILLTKEAFEIHARQLREERAREYGLTLEEWDKAVADMAVVQRIVQDHVSGSIQ